MRKKSLKKTGQSLVYPTGSLYENPSSAPKTYPTGSEFDQWWNQNIDSTSTPINTQIDAHLYNNRASISYKDTNPTPLTSSFIPPILPNKDPFYYRDTIDPLLSTPKKPNTVLKIVKGVKSLKDTKTILLKSFKNVTWNNPAGVDKLMLTTRDFKLETSANFRLRYHDRPSLEDSANSAILNNLPDIIDGVVDEDILIAEVKNDLIDHIDINPHTQLPLLTTDNEEVVRGRSIYRNFEFFTVDITKFGEFPSVKINFNPSKMQKKFFGRLANPEDVRLCLREIEKICREELSLKLNLDDANLARLDLTKDRQMDKAVYEYNEVFNHLKLSRSKHEQQYPSGFMQSNTRRAYIFYDKGVEYLDRKISSSNYMRGEYRFTRPESCQSAELYTPKSLYQLGEDGVNQTYNDLFVDTILRVPPSTPGQLCINYNDLHSIMEYVTKTYKRNQSLHFQRILSSQHLLKLFTEVNLEKFFLQYFERNHVYNIMKDLRQTINTVKVDNSKFNLISAYHEVKEKFAA